MASACLLGAGAIAWAGPAVSYTAVDLDDMGGPNDLWRYDYVISGPLDAAGGIELSFSPSFYGELLSQTSADPDNLLSPPVQPDAGFGSSGLINLQRLTELMDMATTTLSVEFVWLGAGTPGSQTFQVFDANSDFIGEARTVAAAASGVPEPAGLVAAALLALAVTTRQRRKA